MNGPRAHVLVRVWLPDRPGALGQVASRIGAVRGDIVGVDVLECDGGVAIDEFAVNLAHADLVPILVREIEEVDGASIEEVRVVGHFPDPRLDALESATKLCQSASTGELHRALSAQVCEEFLADWTALIVGAGAETKAEVLATAGARRRTPTCSPPWPWAWPPHPWWSVVRPAPRTSPPPPSPATEPP